MPVQKPESARDMAEALALAASAGKTIRLEGAGTKTMMGGPVANADVSISTVGLSRVLQYEPRDLTISVEPGLRFGELTRLLAANRQMIPLDPPFGEEATVGGVIASNGSGPRRRLYGAPRDLVIGMTLATLEGKLVDTGGMVVKNVAGLDMGKLMIGSFGTLAAIVKINFKLIPMPPRSRTFLMAYDSAAAAMTARDSILRSVLQPAAVDYLNSQAAVHFNRNKHLLLVQTVGSAAVLERYAGELGGIESLEGAEEEALWRRLVNFTPHYLLRHTDGAVVRASCTLKDVQRITEMLDVPVIARAATGVCYGYFWEADRADRWVRQAASKGVRCAIEFAPEARKPKLDLWPNPDSGFTTMEAIKNLFDPQRLLNRGRLYGRI